MPERRKYGFQHCIAHFWICGQTPVFERLCENYEDQDSCNLQYTQIGFFHIKYLYLKRIGYELSIPETIRPLLSKMKTTLLSL